jgi:hypothetical protein
MKQPHTDLYQRFVRHLIFHVIIESWYGCFCKRIIFSLADCPSVFSGGTLLLEYRRSAAKDAEKVLLVRVYVCSVASNGE